MIYAIRNMTVCVITSFRFALALTGLLGAFLLLLRPVSPQMLLLSGFAVLCATIMRVREIAKAESNRRLLLDAVPAMVWHKDAHNRIVRCNSAAAATLGRTVEEVEGHATVEFYPADAERYHQDDLEVIRTNRPKIGIVEPYEKKGGQRIWVRTDKIPHRDARGRADGVVVFSVDVSERVKGEERQRFLSGVSRELAATRDPRAMAELGARRGVPFLADVGVVELVGEERAFVVAAPSRPPGTAEGIQRIPGPISDPEYAGRLQELGLPARVSVPITLHGWEFGCLTLLAASPDRFGPEETALAHDFAHRLALALDNARLFAKAEAGARARQDLLASVSHELKNPLATVELNAGLLSLSVTDGGLSPLPLPLRNTLTKSVRMIAISAKRMTRLTADLLDLSKLESGTFSLRLARQCPNELLADLVELADLFAQEKSQRLLRQGAPLTEALHCDRERILQVLLNLVRNALKFTPAHGVVTVKARESEGEVQFSVSDNGPGIASDHLHHIFDRYWQASLTRHLGTGLGLSISRGIVEAHGGTIEVRSEVGHGSCFTVRLPRKGVACPPPPVGLTCGNEVKRKSDSATISG